MAHATMNEAGVEPGPALAGGGEDDAFSYDVLPYESHAFATTHPDRLATVAALFGMAPAPVERCRVLEMGCASGGNIIPMAAYLPESRFVGVDLSARQIADGRKAIEALGLRNVELLHQGIETIGPELGTFDYIVTHGIYSWVPEDVREKILAVSCANLAENGVAYVSYNTYPGWHMPQSLREMMLYHIDRFTEPRLRVKQARALLRFLLEAAENRPDEYSRYLKREIETLIAKRDDYIFHEHLEKVNHPVYFHEFIGAAERHGLRYLGEARVSTMILGGFPEKITAKLREVGDIVQQEQYMDFLHNRRFRSTLLCHAASKLQRALHPARVTQFFVTPVALPKSDDWRKAFPDKIVLVRPNGHDVQIAVPRVLKSAFPVIWENCPKGVPFGVLAAAVRIGKSGDGAAPDASDKPVEEQLAGALLQLYLSDIIALHRHAPDIAIRAGARPKVSPLTRYQARESGLTTNQSHEHVRLSAFERELVQLLDGGHDKAAIVAAMAARAKKIHAAAKAAGKDTVKDFPPVAKIGLQVENSLRKLARSALLMA